MMSNICRACLKDLNIAGVQGLHPVCYKKLFHDQKVSLRLPYKRTDIIEEVRIRSLRMSLQGAQPKVALGVKKGELLIVDYGGLYLLKPSTDMHPYISENEHLCMNLATKLGLTVPPCCLVELEGGENAFLIKRFDRKKKLKIHMEDLCSVLNELSANKDGRSYQEMGEAIGKYCQESGLALIAYFRATLFGFLIGNNDLHLKNFALIESGESHALAPIYDMLCAARYYPNAEDMCLTLIPGYEGDLATYGYHTARDFKALGIAIGLNEAQIAYQISSLLKAEPVFFSFIDRSFLPHDERKRIREIFKERFQKMSRGFDAKR